MLERFVLSREEKVEHSLEHFCDIFSSSGALSHSCHLFMDYYEKEIIEFFERGERIDEVCQRLDICPTQCSLFPKNHKTNKVKIKFNKNQLLTSKKKNLKNNKLSLKFPEKWIKEWENMKKMKKVFSTLLPDSNNDLDGDYFSSKYPYLRGTYWRGKDCHDDFSEMYPGRKKRDQKTPDNVDHNCNGIKGLNKKTNKNYEDEFCFNPNYSSNPNDKRYSFNRRGIAIVGDSVGARFRIPESLFFPEKMDFKHYKHLLRIIEMEGDWPEQSWGTGFMNDTTGLTPGFVKSLYMRMKERNQCVHRDFQNLAHNGCDSNEVTHNIKLLNRNPKTDYPMTVVIDLVGNDVCNYNKDTFKYMTKPDVFYNNIIKTLDYLSTVLPMNSHVVLIGVVDGRILFNSLKSKVHPIGTPYVNFFDFLTCIGSSPCYGWHSLNETVRNLTSQHGSLLNSQLERIAKEKKGYYKNFEIIHIKNGLTNVSKRYKGDHADLIEKVDGFHLSAIGNHLFAEYIWGYLQKNHPDSLPYHNPNNMMISKTFGDQGGY